MNVWLKYKLSTVLDIKEPLSISIYKERLDYLAYELVRAQEIKALLAHRPDITYPRLVVLTANHLPSPYRYPTRLNSDGTLNIDVNRVINVPDDSLITLTSAKPPQSISHSVVITNNPYMNPVHQAIDLIVAL